MKNILCFGDSNTNGSNPDGAPFRHPYEVRWPGRLQALLGAGYHVIEEGMGGRTTVWDDPLEPWRCGVQFLPIALQSHQPLDLVILSLGTNDCKPHLGGGSAAASAAGMRRLVQTVRQFAYRPGAPAPQVMVIAPIWIAPGVSQTFPPFDEGAVDRIRGFGPLYRAVAEENGCLFLDAATVAGPGADHLHMDAAGHAALAEAVARIVRTI